MMVLPAQRAYVSLPPKTASAAIYRTLRQVKGSRQEGAYHEARQAPKGWRSILAVRHPTHRLASWYANNVKNWPDYEWGTFAEFFHTRFVLGLNKERRSSAAIRAENRTLCEYERACKATGFLRFEHLAADMHAAFGVEVTADRPHESGRPPTEEMLTEDDEALIVSRFGEDYARFGYEPIWIRGGVP